jgi:small subunit ribosomal protein S20
LHNEFKQAITTQFEVIERGLIPCALSGNGLKEGTVANIKSQIKRIKTNEKARLRNKSVRSAFKTAIRRFRDALTSGDSKTIATELQTASRELDIAVSKGVIHSNQAANKKSAMAKAAHKAGQKAGAR